MTTTALLSPRDVAWHQHWGLLIRSHIQKLVEADNFNVSHKKKYIFDNVGTTSRLLEPKAFPLNLRHVVYDLEVDKAGNITGGSGSIKEIQETVWNAASRTNPLVDEVRVRAAKKQAAARNVVKVESRDDRQVAMIDPVTELYVDLGRTNEEVRPNRAVQALRKVDFSRVALYSGGASAVKAAQKEKQKYDAMPPAAADKSKAEKIADLEQKIRELMGLLK